MKSRIRAKSVLDASAILAYLQHEPGYKVVQEALETEAAVSTVNLAEVYAKVVASGQELEPIMTRLLALGLDPQPFTNEDAVTSTSFHAPARSLGLSLGEGLRPAFGQLACLAVGLRLRLPILTADQMWRELKLETEIRVIR